MIGRERIKIARRFWMKVKKTENCWIWLGAKLKPGYGKIQINKRPILAHRFSYELANGPIPPGLFVLHHCDNPPCIRASHLFLGTQKDNQQDSKRKGRRVDRGGEANTQAELEEREIIEIREKYSMGRITQKDLGSEYGVGQDHISRIINKKRWAHA